MGPVNGVSELQVPASLNGCDHRSRSRLKPWVPTIDVEMEHQSRSRAETPKTGGKQVPAYRQTGKESLLPVREGAEVTSRSATTSHASPGGIPI
jgi:hypothetical protein